MRNYGAMRRKERDLPKSPLRGGGEAGAGELFEGKALSGWINGLASGPLISPLR